MGQLEGHTKQLDAHMGQLESQTGQLDGNVRQLKGPRQLEANLAMKLKEANWRLK